MGERGCTAPRRAEKRAGGSWRRLWTLLPRAGPNHRGARTWRCPKVSARASACGTGALRSLRRALRHVHLGRDPLGSRLGSAPRAIWHPPWELPPEPCPRCCELPPRHCPGHAPAASTEGGEERDPANVIFDGETHARCSASLLMWPCCPWSRSAARCCWVQLRGSRTTSQNPAPPAPPCHSLNVFSLVPCAPFSPCVAAPCPPAFALRWTAQETALKSPASAALS